MQLSKKIIAFNIGSSSIKFALFEIGETEHLVFSGSLTKIGNRNGTFSVMDDQGLSL